MIKSKDVIRIKLPYPNSNSKLAFTPHMYICISNENGKTSFIKCQSLKPYMFSSNIISSFIDEVPNIERNPFINDTRIDCDKLFCMYGLEFDISLRTNRRPDICDELYNEIMIKLSSHAYKEIEIDRQEILKFNNLIRFCKS